MTCWYEIRCKGCNKRNWINNGNLEDMTVSDVEGFRCWCCGMPQVVNGFDFAEDDDDHFYVVDGLAAPI